ncbi:unnamed protein product [Rangifer tarandus platyrhynchus]|uniref:Uncharacterized protein n=1 Tax=Rangifer tarandus platyrhynchus TaxID=3082113 RepID=A0ABN8Y3Q5_RANTA|nr:unnamed protein product [Rangifer tarandus platyrhynchus]
MLALPEDSGPPVCSEGVEETPGRSWEGLCPLAPRAAQQQKPPAFEGWPRSACSAQVPFQNALGEGHLRSLPWAHFTDPRAHASLCPRVQPHPHPQLRSRGLTPRPERSPSPGRPAALTAPAAAHCLPPDSCSAPLRTPGFKRSLCRLPSG